MKTAIAFIEQLENVRNEYLNKLNASVRRAEIRKLIAKCKGMRLVAVAFNREQEITLRQLAPVAEIIKNEPLSYSEYRKIARAAFQMTRRALGYGGIRQKMLINGIDFSKALEHYLIDETVQALRKAHMTRKTLLKHRPDSVVVQSEKYRTGGVAMLVSSSLGIPCTSAGGIISSLKSRARDKMGRKFYFEDELYAARAGLFSITANGGRKILVDSRYINHLRAIKPIIEKLQNKFSVSLFCHEAEARRAFANMERIPVEIKRDGTSVDLRNGISMAENEARFRKIFSYLGTDIWPALKETYLFAFSGGLSKLVQEAAMFEKLLKQTKPDLLMAGDDRAIGIRCHVLAAKKLGIKTVDVQHGLDPDIAAMSAPVSDLLIMGGLYSKKHFMQFGADERRIRVVGWPQYDALASRGNKAAKGRVQKFLFAPDAAYALQNVEVLKLLQYSLDDGDILIVKPHPGDDEELYRDAVRRSNVQVVPKKDSIINYIKETDVTITGASTAGLEALLLGRPLVVINLEREVNTGYVYTSFGVAVEVKSAEEIKNLKKALEKNFGRIRRKIPSFIRMCAYKVDGKAAERAANEVEKLILR